MLSCISYIGNIATAKSNFSWNADLDAVCTILSQRFDNFNDNGFYAHPDEVELRKELARVPTLAHLTEGLRGLRANGAVLYGLGLAGLPEERRNAALYALALMLGYPTSTDRRTGRVAWDVRATPVQEDGSRFTTFSERIGRADMHTDSSFYPMPEEQFILYVVNAANCHGGHSLLIDAEEIYEALQRTPEGRAAFELLSTTPVPFRVPAVYAAGDDTPDVFVSTVFSPSQAKRPRARPAPRFMMRWRYDSIIKGLDARPDLDTPALRDAVELMNEAAETGAKRFIEQLPTDTLMLVDNHHMLHGRTTFTDECHHLIRIRISDVPNAERIGPSGVDSD